MSAHPLTPNFLSSIYANLTSNWLMSGLIQMEGAVTQADALYEKIRQIKESYELLLKYMEKGVEDTTREEQYTNFRRQALEIYDHLHARQKQSVYHSVFPDSPTADSVDDSEEWRLSFNGILLSDQWSETELLLLEEKLSTAPVANKFFMTATVSAISLSLFNVFDAYKLRALFAVYFSDLPLRCKVRSLVGIVFSLIIHEKRLDLYPDLRLSLQQLLSDPFFESQLTDLQYQVIQCNRTKKDNKAIAETIMPWMNEKAKHIGNIWKTDQFSFQMNDFVIKGDEDDQMMSELEDKLKKMKEFHDKGTDTFYISFAQMSRTLSFFDKIENWFIPFHFSNSQIDCNGLNLERISMMFRAQDFSDTSCYAFLFFINNLPSDIKQSVIESIKQSDVITAAADIPTEDNNPTVQIRYYLQDLYRFFTLYKHKQLFDNPFSLCEDFKASSHLQKHFMKTDILRRFSEVYISDKEWAKGLEYYQLIAPADLTFHDFELIGLCKENLGQTDEALIDFEHALVLSPDSIWCLTHLANLYFDLHNYSRALTLYETVYRIEPHNYRALIRQGECLIYQRDYMKAENLLSKADYEQDSAHSKRALAWLYFMERKFEKAEEKFEQLFQTGHIYQTDYLNAGNLQLVLGNMGKAVSLYAKYLYYDPEHVISNRDLFERDKATLMEMGISIETLHLIADLVLLYKK